MLATAWGLGITYPQSIKRLGHFLTADCKSAGTPNGGKDISGTTDAGGIGMGTERIIPQPANCGLGDLHYVIDLAVEKICPLASQQKGIRLVFII